MKHQQHAFFAHPASMFREVETAVEAQREYLLNFKDQVRRYTGRFYKGKGEEAPDMDSLENHAHDVLSYVIPNAVFNNPKFKVGTLLGGAQRDVVKALGPALNRTVKAANLGEKLVAVLTGMVFNSAVGMVTQDPIPGVDPMAGLDPLEPGTKSRPHRPDFTNIQAELFFEDTVAKDRTRIRFQGHTQTRDLGSIKAEAAANPSFGWDLNTLEHQGRNREENFALEDVEDGSENRQDVSFHEIWVPEYELDRFPDGTAKPSDGWKAHGFHGTILTLSVKSPSGKDGGWLRKPRPYYGPPCGPYRVFGVYEVPNETKPLGLLTVVEEQSQDLNKHARVMAGNAKDHKKIVLVKHTSPRILNLIKNTKHHHVAAIPGFDKSGVQEVELAGINQHDLAYNQVAQDRLNRASHMDDARRGQTTSGATATGVAEAAESSDIRMSWVEEQFARGVTAIARKMLWYLFHDNRVAFPLGSEHAEALGMEAQEITTQYGETVKLPPEPWFQGGWEPGQPPFSGLEMEIVPMSMKRQNQAEWRQSLMDCHRVLQQEVIPLAMQLGPALDWKGIVLDICEVHGHPELADRYDIDKLLEQQPTIDPRLAGPILVAQGGQTNPSLGGAQRQGQTSGTGSPNQPQQPMQLLKGGSPAMQGGAPVQGFQKGAEALQGAS